MLIPKKPPDKYKTFKISLNKIIVDKHKISKLPLITMNKLIIHVYQFLRLWILHQFSTNKPIILITEGVIRMAFKVFLKDSAGPKPKGDNLLIYTDFKTFYTDTYKKLGYKLDLFTERNLSVIIDYTCTDMLTNIENNIKQRFIDHVKRFVNSYYKKEFNNDPNIINLDSETKKELKKELWKKINCIKKDLIEDTLNADPKYHHWINEYKEKFFPKTYAKSYYYDIQVNPQKYLKYMFNINVELEKVGSKQIQFFPLRKSLYPKYIPLDTRALIDIYEENKNSYLDKIQEQKDNIWSKFINLNNKIFKHKNYVFNYFMMTDGFAVSLQFMHKNYIEKETEKKMKMKIARKKKRDETKSKNSILNDMSLDLNENISDNKIKQNKNMSSILNELDDEIKLEENKEVNKNKKEKEPTHIEFPYIDDLEGVELELLKEAYKIYIDPGKTNLFMMMDDKGIYFRYTNKQRVFETKRLQYQKRIENEKIKRNITLMETKLSSYNSNSCSIEKFQEYIEKKNITNVKLIKRYEDPLYRKLKWYSYLNSKRSDDNLLNTMEKKYGKDAVIIIGDWEIPKQMQNYISTPNIRLKRVLAKKFKVYNFDEHKTSCINYKTETRCEILKLKDPLKEGKIRKIHHILKYQTESGRLGCINRDKNAVNNYKKIIDHWMKTKERLKNYRREGREKPITPMKITSKKKGKEVSNKGESEQTHILTIEKIEKAKKKPSTKIIVKSNNKIIKVIPLKKVRF